MDLLYFETFMTSIYEKKIREKYGLFMYNKRLFIISSFKEKTMDRDEN